MFIIYNYQVNNSANDVVVNFSEWSVFSPLTGLVSLLTKQIGGSSLFECGLQDLYPLVYKDGFEISFYYSLIIMGVVSAMLIEISSIVLNPLYRRRSRVNKVKNM